VTSQIVAAFVVDDGIDEDETVVLPRSEPGDAPLGTNSPAILTIAEGYKVYLPADRAAVLVRYDFPAPREFAPPAALILPRTRLYW